MISDIGGSGRIVPSTRYFFKRSSMDLWTDICQRRILESSRIRKNRRSGQGRNREANWCRFAPCAWRETRGSLSGVQTLTLTSVCVPAISNWVSQCRLVAFLQLPFIAMYRKERCPDLLQESEDQFSSQGRHIMRYEVRAPFSKITIQWSLKWSLDFFVHSYDLKI